MYVFAWQPLSQRFGDLVEIDLNQGEYQAIIRPDYTAKNGVIHMVIDAQEGQQQEIQPTPRQFIGGFGMLRFRLRLGWLWPD